MCSIFICDPTGIILDANQAMLDLFGYTRSEMMRMNVWDTDTDPEGPAKFVRAADKTGSVRNFDARLQKKSGEEMDCLVTATSRRAEDGRILVYQGIVRDITEQKRAEAAIKKISGTSERVGGRTDGPNWRKRPGRPNRRGTQPMTPTKPRAAFWPI